jgi:hypothetical protein
MQLNYYILRDIVNNQPVFEEVEISLQELGSDRYHPEKLQKECICAFLDIYLEETPLNIN